MSDQKLTFLPFFRRSFPLEMNTDGGKSRQEGILKLQAESMASANAAPDSGRSHEVEHTVRLVGPGDVLAIQPEIIARLEPPPQSQDHEPNYLVFMEYKDPSFLWKYSLSTFDTEHVQPWLALIVLTSEELRSDSVSFLKAQDGRSLIKVSKSLLPPCTDQTWDWATAHVQLDGFDDSRIPTDATDEQVFAAIEEFINQYPERSCCRLFCTRGLKPETNYMAILVPYYLAALENRPETDESVFAGDEDVVLPIYYSWSFMTAERGDFEYLARSLRRVPAQKGLGQEAVDTSANFEDPENIANKFLFREGALARPGFTGTAGAPPSEDPRIEYTDQLVHQARTAEVLERVNRNVNDPCRRIVENSEYDFDIDDENVDPLITMPYYGSCFQQPEELEVADNEGRWAQANSWMEELNLDFRQRLAAGLGTNIVQRHQEDYMREAWNQVGQLRPANEKLRLARTAQHLARILDKKYLTPLTDERFVLRTRPFHAHATETDVGPGTSLKGRLAISGLSPGLIQPTFSRLAHKTIGLRNIDLFEPWRLAFQRSDHLAMIRCLVLRIPANFLKLLAKVPKGLYLMFKGIPVTRSLVVQNKFEIRYLGRALLSGEQILLTAGSWFANRFGSTLCGRPRKSNREFWPFCDRVKQEFEISAPYGGPLLEPKLEIVPVRPIDIGRDFRPRFNAGRVIQTRVRQAIHFSNELRSVPESLEPLKESPNIKDRLYTRLKEISTEIVLPGVSDLIPNSITLTEENRRFIESVGVGACQAMNEELGWRGFPVDWQGSPFRYFWDPVRFVSGEQDDLGQPALLPDYKEIKEFEEPLGFNAIADESESAQLVLVIKGDIVRRYPDTIYFALQVGPTDPPQVPAPLWTEASSPDSEVPVRTIDPVFRAQLAPDVLAIGFPLSLDDVEQQDRNIYLGLQQPQELPRFGLDINSEGLDASWEDVTGDLVNGYISKWSGINGINENDNSARIAERTFQKPIRLLIHSSELLG